MRVAIIHYWLVGMRGGERVIEQLCQLYPQADIYTHVVNPDALSDVLRAHRIETTWISKLPFAERLYQAYLPFMPRALEELDLTSYDLVISSESGPAKGVIVHPDARHVCYCHSPMRYIWDQYGFYTKDLNPIKRAVFARVAHKLRMWDVTSAARVDRFVANSSFIAERIQRYYRRDADVIAPPVDTDYFAPSPDGPKDFYLFVSELVGYKRADLVVEAFNALGLPLMVIGDGEQMEHLQRIAKPNVTLRGRQPRAELKAAFAACKALVFPAEEDFGIVPVEAMASGRPVIAYAGGGARDTVKPGVSGVTFPAQTVEALIDAVRGFEDTAADFDSDAIVRHAASFSEARFRDAFAAVAAEVMADSPRR